MKKLIILLSVVICSLFLLYGCGNSAQKGAEEAASSKATWNEYTFEEMVYSAPNNWNGDGSVDKDGLVLFSLEDGLFYLSASTRESDINDLEARTQLAQEFNNAFAGSVDAGKTEKIAGKVAFEMSGKAKINDEDYIAKVNAIQTNQYLYTLTLFEREDGVHDTEYETLLKSIKFNDGAINEGLSVTEKGYLDTLRNNLSTAGASLSEIEEDPLNDGTISLVFTFTNPDDSTNPDYKNVISTHSTDSGILDRIVMNTKNTSWAYPYAYAMIGSIEGQAPAETILEELNIDMNNGYYGTGGDSYDYNGHFYLIQLTGDDLLFMVSPAEGE